MNNTIKYNQSGEDYLECLLMLSKELDIVHRIDVAKRMNVSQAAVNKAIKLLFEKQYVYEDGKHLYLTENGKKYAEEVFEKHCIIREFLIKNGVPSTVAEQDACNMEHVISEQTFSFMKKFVKESK